jgi:hypothetical protein
VRFDGPTHLRERLDTDPLLRGLERVPPAVDLAAVRGDLDAVVVLGLGRADAEVRRHDRTRAVTAELSAHYTEVATSPTGLGVLWRADPAPGHTAGGGSAAAPTG